MKTKLFYSVLLFAIVNLLFAQDPFTLKLTEKSGLPDVEIYDIIEDNNDFIWIAANKGLFRFDGKNYQSFTNENKRGLSVFNLKIDSQNRIWCNTISGQFFYVNEDKLELFLDLKNELKGELADFIFNENKLFVFGIQTILEIDLKTKQKKNILNTIDLPSKSIRSPFLFNNKIYFTINNQVFSLFNNKVEQETHNGINNYAEKINIKIFSYKKELYLNVYEILSNKNHFFKINNTKLEPFLLPEILVKNRIIKVSEQDSLLWFCTQKGLVSAEIFNKNFVTKDVFFSEEFITNKIVDKNQNVWLSTINSGIYIIPDLKVRVYEKVIANNTIATVEKIDNEILAIGTLNGDVYLKNLNKNTFTSINVGSKSKISLLLFLKEVNILLISSESNSYIYNFLNKKLSKSDSFINSKDLKQIGNSNKIIHCGFDRASVLEYNNGVMNLVKTLDINRSYKSFYDDKLDQIYVVYIDNLIRYDSDYKSTILKYKGKNIIAKDINKTLDNTVWITTYNDGVLAYKNDKFNYKLDVSNGLASNLVERIKCDDNNLWIVTDKSLQVYNSNDKKFHPTLFNSNTLNGNIKNYVFYKNKTLFSTQEDFLIINNNKVFKKQLPKKIYIKAIAINERDTIVKQHYSLPYDKNRIKISFHVNGYFSDDELVYEYKLSGLNEEWIALDKNVSFVYFNSLSSGDYTFEVRVKNNTNSAKINFQINQPYWKKWWFIMSIFLLCLALIILFYRNKLAINEKEKELAIKNANYQNELAILKLENLKSQMNPHFIFNALNSIQEYIVLNQKQLASSYLAKFADLIRTYLEHSSKGFITVREEIECLETYLELEKLRFEEKFMYQINSSNSYDEFKIPTMLIQPYVENAIKHGLLHKKEDRRLNITFERFEEEQTIQCTILDNGVGREKASEFRNKKHESFATKATQNRLELLNFGKERKIGVTTEDLFDKNNQPCGTNVTILIPILKK